MTAMTFNKPLCKLNVKFKRDVKHPKFIHFTYARFGYNEAKTLTWEIVALPEWNCQIRGLTEKN